MLDNSSGGVKLKKWNLLIIAILCFSLNACAPTSQSDEKPLHVDYCDLVKNPEQYDERVVRVRARHLIIALEYSYITDDNCSSELTQTWVVIPHDTWREGVKQTSESLPHGYDTFECEVTLVGTFHNSNFGAGSGYPFYIDFICLERAGKWKGIR